VVIDASGLYRQGVKQYNLVLGPRISMTRGKWRPFVHAMAGVQQNTSDNQTFHPLIEDIGGGVDRKFQFLFLKKFSWRLQFDYVHSHLLSASQNDVKGSLGLVWRF
jgi:hypothetical protein